MTHDQIVAAIGIPLIFLCLIIQMTAALWPIKDKKDNQKGCSKCGR